MKQGHWTLIETLGPRAEWSALAVDRRTAQWKSLTRALPIGVLVVAEEAHAAAARLDREMPPSRNRTEGNHVSVSPILGPAGVVHGMTVYVGQVPAPEAPLRPVAAFCFSSTDRVIDGVEARWTLAEALHQVERFDGAMELLPDALSPTTSTRWAGRLTVRVDGTPRNLHVAMKNGVDDDLTRWRGLVHDITDIAPPEQLSLDSAILTALREHESHGTYIALVDTTNQRLVRWITQPLPNFQWQGDADDGWLMRNSTATPVPTPGPPELVLLEFKVADDE